jgi:hypothetical protein
MAGKITGSRQRGMSMIETLAAFFVLFVVTIAVLQLFSMATTVNLGSLVRTDLAHRAGKVLEVIRLQHVLSRQTPAANNDNCCPLAAGTRLDIPGTTTACKTFWGEAGFGVWQEGAPFLLSYEIVAQANGREIVVTARPRTSGPNRYMGSSATAKVVQYVARIR